MKKSQHYVCNECGYVSIKWYGRCPECNSWESMILKEDDRGKAKTNKAKKININDIIVKDYDILKCNDKNINRLFGNGIVKGSVSLIAGPPGIGKSTFAFYVMDNIKIEKMLYISAEESHTQIKMRAMRVNLSKNFDVIISNCVDEFIDELRNYELVILDSIQTVNSSLMQGISGSPTMVKYVLSKIMEECKKNNVPLFVIGHITKDGMIAGPKTLEHMVDSVFYIEKIEDDDLRIVKSVKNRFGSTDEIILMKMEEQGLKIMENIDSCSIKEQMGIGKTVSCTVKGTIPIAIEIQALVNYSKYGMPQRVSTGINYKRMQMLVGILDKYLNLNLGSRDIFLNVSNGIMLNDSLCDLAFLYAIYSSLKNKNISSGTAFIGEASLSGDIKSSKNINIRIKHLKNLGISRIFSPQIDIDEKDVVFIKNIKDFEQI